MSSADLQPFDFFAERLPGLAFPSASEAMTARDISDGNGPRRRAEMSRKLLACPGITVSGETALRHLKRGAQRAHRGRKLRIVSVDEWAWRRGAACGTIVVHVVIRTAFYVLSHRSSASLATWLSLYPGWKSSAAIVMGSYAEDAARAYPKPDRD